LTRNELKLIIIMNSHPTYEELKLGTITDMRPAFSIHILPMRNWNTSPSVFDKVTQNIHILPMRNWNLHPHKRINGQFQFTSYLWGIETQNKKDGYNKGRKFTSYLWGIETADCNIYCPVGDEFTSYLWGIETQDKNNKPILAVIIHILPMRNWNFFLCLVLALVLAIHILPMRNWNYHISTHFYIFLLKFTSYLWGIETQKIPLWAKAQRGIHILPMRNWNSCCFSL